MSITRRSLLAGAVAVPVAACQRNKGAFSELDQYRVKGWQVMRRGYDPVQFSRDISDYIRQRTLPMARERMGAKLRANPND